MSKQKQPMRYLFKVIPIPRRWWVKVIIGILWVGEASLETQAYYAFLPKYLTEIVGPLFLITFASSIFAVTVGAIHLGLGLVEGLTAFKKKMGWW